MLLRVLRPSVRAYLCVLEELPPEPMFSSRQRFLLPIQSSERTILAVKLCSCAQHPFTCTSSCEPSTWPLRCPRKPASSSRGLCSWTAAPAPATARRGRGKGKALGLAGKDSRDPPFRWWDGRPGRGASKAARGRWKAGACDGLWRAPRWRDFADSERDGLWHKPEVELEPAVFFFPKDDALLIKHIVTERSPPSGQW
jgi:hypothetical protein